jgi:hypothetical protein
MTNEQSWEKTFFDDQGKDKLSYLIVNDKIILAIPNFQKIQKRNYPIKTIN